MFFIKFLGKIENILGDASNIFNFTLEFNEKHFNPHFLFLLKTKKTVEKVFGRVTYSGNSYLGEETASQGFDEVFLDIIYNKSVANEVSTINLISNN